jgi:D-glycero-D-manno-heptose 1,7-bisphosphate phosphatase
MRRLLKHWKKATWLNKRRKAIFLDRDGVLIENQPGYVRSWADVQVLPGVPQALEMLRLEGFVLLVVSNQSVVGRGLMSLETMQMLNRQIEAELLRLGGGVDASYLCPHAPNEGCACRKPQPGLLLQAAQDWQVDLQQSFLIGDALTDLQAGRAAGARPLLVRSGRGAAQERLLDPQEWSDLAIFDNLADAARWICSRREGR